ncbi:ABC transporter substrate-binding protein [Sinorhizobium meliloti]|nr:ABC transporter substrate-binding protein [Sinorhizobium meliloti]RVH03948.1 ABC transporter substrate-binding protein [Sinorhizobium meliloti]
MKQCSVNKHHLKNQQGNNMQKYTRTIFSITLAGTALLMTQETIAANTLTWANADVYKDIDPASGYDLETLMLGNVYETLTFYKNGKVQPRLAVSWEKSNDGKTWTVKLRGGVKFQDGSPFDSAAVKKSMLYTRDLGKGAAFLWSTLKDVETPDRLTAVFQFSAPIAFDLVASAQYGSYIIAPVAIDNGHEWMQAGNAIGTGPYKLSKFDPGKLAVLEKFDDYWGGWQPGQIDRVIQTTVFEPSTRVQMVKSQENVITVVPTSQIKALEESQNVAIAAGTSWRNFFFPLNTKKYPTDNLKFRQALSHLWNSDSIIENVWNGRATRPEGPLPATMWGHGKYELPKYDPAEALKLLEESGVPKKDWKITAAYQTGRQEYADAMELFQQAAAEVGVEVELVPFQSQGTLNEKLRKLETSFNMTHNLWWPAYATPSDWLYSCYRTQEKVSFNYSYYADPEFDSLVDKAMAEEGVDLKASANSYIKAQDLLMKDTPAIFAADGERAYAYSSNIAGMESSLNPAYETLFVYDLSLKQ